MGLEGEDQSDGGGLAALFVRHRPELLRFLASRCGDAGEAEDLLQDLWIKASAQPGGPIANGRAYLFRMANNLVLDRRRGEQRAMRRDRAWLVEAGGGDAPPEDRPDPAPAADEQLARGQEAELLRQAISTLPPGAQRALRLHRLEGYQQGEVAEIMGISRSGVEKHLALAMKHLKIALTNCGFAPGAASGQQGQNGGAIPQPDKQR
ncbi:MAG: hypothetical protein RIQ46_1480 [Pseudomonadota bacterium]